MIDQVVVSLFVVNSSCLVGSANRSFSTSGDGMANAVLAIPAYRDVGL